MGINSASSALSASSVVNILPNFLSPVLAVMAAQIPAALSLAQCDRRHARAMDTSWATTGQHATAASLHSLGQ